jgi:hypothetical protein
MFITGGHIYPTLIDISQPDLGIGTNFKFICNITLTGAT